VSQIILVTGGSRSGKSAYSQKLAESMPGPRTFIATGLPIDDEMRDRICRHQEARSKHEWTTIEEPLNLQRALSRAQDSNVLLVDCLTLWINNLMYEAEKSGVKLTETDISQHCEKVIAACEIAELIPAIVAASWRWPQ
jgi:adenosylcobinamide kinase/adenosylcobinamide-phosphate guanylyltransferase